MKILRTASGGSGLEASVVTQGVYDGVHIGHRKIISEVVEESVKSGIPSAAVTFRPHPSHVLPGSAAGILTVEEEKIRLLRDCGLDFCLLIDFTGDFARKTAEDFVREVTTGFLGAKTVIVGTNHVFGAGRRGDAALLGSLGKKYGFRLKLIEPVRFGGTTVSSSKIRELIADGKVEETVIFLGRKFSLSGRVIRGEGQGASMGFPTANIELPPRMIKPAPGVYSGICSVGGRRSPAVLYTGYKPSSGVPLKHPSVEVHIIGSPGNIYGKRIRFEFSRRLRADIKFNCAEALRRRIAEDVRAAADSL